MIIEASEMLSLRLRLTDVRQSEEEVFFQTIVIYIIYYLKESYAS